jgi:tetratricopeptide (TPR) repeat protein
MVLPAVALVCVSCAHTGKSFKVTDGIHKETPDEKNSSEIYYRFLRSENLALQGAYDRAMADLGEVIRANPESGYLYYELANDEFDQKHFPEAEAACLKALELSPNMTGARILLSKLYALQEKHSESVDVLMSTIRDNPKDQETYFLLAREYIELKRYNAAINVVQKYLANDPESTPGNLFLGMIYGSYMKQYDKAIAAYQKVLETDPDNMRVMAALAQTYLEKKDVKRAMELFTKMEQLAPDDLSIQLKMALVYYYDMKDLNKAIGKFEKILAANPDSDIIRYYLALVYAETKNMDVAVKYFEQIPPKSNYYKDARINVAQYYFAKDDIKKGVAIVEEAISKKPEDIDFFLYLGGIYEQMGMFDKMIETLKKGLVVYPDNEKMAYAIAIAYERIGERQKAVTAMRNVLKINPKNTSAMNFVGYSMIENGGNLDEAETLLQDAISLKPDDAYILDSLGWLYFKRGDYTKAYELLTQASKILPNEVAILEHLGDLNKERGYTKQALAAYRKALKIVKGAKNGNGNGDVKRLEEKICAAGGC